LSISDWWIYLVAFEIQELPDVIRVIVLLNLSKGAKIQKLTLKKRLDRVCASYACIEMIELEKALKEMVTEGLITEKAGRVQLTAQGQKLSKEWESLLLKKEPIMEVVAGLVDGSITSLVVILSAFIASLTGTQTLLGDPRTLIFAALLTLSAVAITGFSSFLLGGITADLADIMTLQNLMNYSLSDIPDKKERDKSLLLVQKLFTVLNKQIHRSNLYGATISGITTFVAGIIPIATYLALPSFYDITVSLGEVVIISGVFLVRYRSKKTRVNWKVTLAETIAIVLIATIVSLLLGSI
jgi:VIT1/CCC1 family predicted Fe2+/Mn2+ transporter